MKKFFILSLLILLPSLLWATNVTIDGINYNLISKTGTAEVIAGDYSYTGSVVIPATVTYEGTDYTVTAIGEKAFYQCSSLTSVTIPSSVITIGSNAFYQCNKLTSVSIPSSVTTIESLAFSYCRSITSIIIPESVTSIGGGAFFYCSGLTSIVIPNNVSTLGTYIFRECTSLTEVSLPNNLTSIPSFFFYNCSNLESIDIPNGVTKIGNSTFYGCTSLTNVDIPNSVTKIGNSTFYGCTSLTAVDIPNNVTSIGSSAFYGCSALTFVSIGSGLQTIYTNAFANCQELTDVYCYAETVPTTDATAFDNSYIDYATLYVPEAAIESYKASAPWSGFKEIKSTSSVESDEVQIDGISYLLDKSGNTAEVIRSLGDAYSGDVVIPNSIEYNGTTYTVTSIGEHAFLNCSSLTSIDLPSTLVSIGDYAFMKSGLTSVNIPSGVSSISNGAFYECTSLASVTLPSSIVTIGEFAFWKSAIASVVLPEGLTSIGLGAFAETNLTSVTIPNSVTSIDVEIFANCTSLTSVTIGSGISEISKCTFEGCTSLSSITVLRETPATIDGTVFSDVDKTTCTLYVPIGCKSAYASADYWSEFTNVLEMDSEMFLGYCNGLIATSSSGKIVGITGSNATIAEAICIPSSMLKAHKGLKIVGVNAGMPSASAYPESLTGWISTSKGGTRIASGTLSGPVEGWNRILFGSSYTITGEEEELWIGFEYVQSSKLNVISFAGDTSADGCWIGKNGSYTDYSSKNFGSLAVEGLLDGDNYPLRNLSIISASTSYTMTKFGNPIKLNVSIGNNALASAPNPVIEVSLNDVSTYVYEYPDTLAYRDKADLKLEIPTESITEEGTVKVGINLNWRDGISDEYETDNEIFLETTLTNDIHMRVMVVEEGTGAWCGYCVRGIVGMNYMRENYPDSFIGIGIHNGDQYTVNDYDAWLADSISGYPEALVNRAKIVDPSSEELESSLENMDPFSVAQMSLKVSLSNDNKLKFKSDLSFLVDAVDAHYDIAFVVLEDSLPIAQSNYYSGGSMGEMGGFEDMTSRADIKINNVARAIYPSVSGSSDLVPTTIVRNKVYTINHEAVLPTIADINNVWAAVLLIDHASGEIIQAAKTMNISDAEESDDTEISTRDNALYIEAMEGRVGGTMDLSIKLKSTEAARGFQFILEVPEGVTINGWALSENRLPTGATTNNKVSSYRIDGNKITVACTLNYGSATFTGNDGEVATVNVTFGGDMNEGTYSLFLTDCGYSNAAGNDLLLEDVNSSVTLESYLVGDANGDSLVRIGDVTAILNYIIGKVPDGFNAKAADANEDGQIRIGDVTTVLNIIMGL